MYKRQDQVALAGDGQVSLGNTVLKGNASKVRRLYRGQVLALPLRTVLPRDTWPSPARATWSLRRTETIVVIAREAPLLGDADGSPDDEWCIGPGRCSLKWIAGEMRAAGPEIKHGWSSTAGQVRLAKYGRPAPPAETGGAGASVTAADGSSAARCPG